MGVESDLEMAMCSGALPPRVDSVRDTFDDTPPSTLVGSSSDINTASLEELFTKRDRSLSPRSTRSATAYLDGNEHDHHPGELAKSGGRAQRPYYWSEYNSDDIVSHLIAHSDAISTVINNERKRRRDPDPFGIVLVGGKSMWTGRVEDWRIFQSEYGRSGPGPDRGVLEADVDYSGKSLARYRQRNSVFDDWVSVNEALVKKAHERVYEVTRSECLEHSIEDIMGIDSEEDLEEAWEDHKSKDDDSTLKVTRFPWYPRPKTVTERVEHWGMM